MTSPSNTLSRNEIENHNFLSSTQEEIVPSHTSTNSGQRPQDGDTRTATVDIVIPVYNEAHTITACIERLANSVSSLLPFEAKITIADNASTDNTWNVAGELCRRFTNVSRVHLDQKGRGRALKYVWLHSDCDVVAYMDVDLSTDLHGLLPLVAPLVSDHSDVAIGSRLPRSSNVVRGPKREFISRTYNHMLRTMLNAHFSDAQCGFKAMRADAAAKILPHVEDPNWFFDTEMLLLAEKAGYRIHEVPVDWTDDPDSRVDVVATAMEDMRGMWRVRKSIATGAVDLDSFRRPRRDSVPPALEGVSGKAADRNFFSHVWRFAVVGVISTVAYAVLYLIFGHMMGAQAANFTALVITTLLNTAANRTFTFGVSGKKGMGKDHASGLVIFVICWSITALSLVVLHAADPHSSTGVELFVLTLANIIATVVRFVALRAWFMARRRKTAATDGKQ